MGPPPVKLVCPACGATHSLEALLTDVSAREAVAAALALPAPLADRVLRYLALFRPAQRALSWDRAAKLLQELLGAVKAGHVERKGRSWAAPLELWQAALDQMLAGREQLTLPLKSHGYLFEVVAGLSSRAEARGEARQEERRQQPLGQRSGMAAVAEVLTRPDPETGKRHIAALKAQMKGGQRDG